METFSGFCSGGDIGDNGRFLWKKGDETDAGTITSEHDEIKPASKQAYEECPEAIDYFCKTMGVKKQELNLIFNFKSMYGNYSYDVGVTGKPELTGTYIFTDTYAYTEDPVGERWYIAKKVTAREKKERNLEEKLGDWCNDYLYEEICPEETEKDSAAVKLSIDESTVKKYKEKRFGTDAIWECWSGEIDQNDHFSVSYYGDTSGWKTGYFDGKKWKIQQHVAVGDEQYYHYDTAAGLLWNFDGKRLTVGDQTRKTVYNFFQDVYVSFLIVFWSKSVRRLYPVYLEESRHQENAVHSNLWHESKN